MYLIGQLIGLALIGLVLYGAGRLYRRMKGIKNQEAEEKNQDFWICPDCNKANSNKETVCSNCGKERA